MEHNVGARVWSLRGPDNIKKYGNVIQKDTIKSVTPGMIPYHIYQVRWDEGHVTIGHLGVALEED